MLFSAGLRSNLSCTFDFLCCDASVAFILAASLDSFWTPGCEFEGASGFATVTGCSCTLVVLVEGQDVSEDLPDWE